METLGAEPKEVLFIVFTLVRYVLQSVQLDNMLLSVQIKVVSVQCVHLKRCYRTPSYEMWCSVLRCKGATFVQNIHLTEIKLQ